MVLNILVMVNLFFTGIGFCVGMIAMAIIADKSNKKQVEGLKKEIEADSNNYYTAVSSLEGQVQKLERELSVQRNVAKTLSENNQRLLKNNQQLKKAVRPNDETITYMVSLYDNWYERSQEDSSLSPSEFIKKYWK